VRVVITTRGTARRQRFLPAALVFFGGLALAAPTAAQLTVTPSEIVLVPGITPAASFTVENRGQALIQATLYQNDWDRNDDGENAFYPVGTVVGSCGDRVKVFPQTVQVQPGVKQSIRVSTEGRNFPSPCWTIVFVEDAPRPARGQSRIVYVMRIGVKVYVLPSGLPKDAEVTGFQMEHRHQVASGPAVDTTQEEFALRIHNTGGMQLHFEGRVEIRDLANKVVATQKIEDFPVLPGAQRRVGIAIPTLPAGHYVALAVVGYGGEDDLAAQLDLEIR
jgi:P pilus assembly chaperone PapD